MIWWATAPERRSRSVICLNYAANCPCTNNGDDVMGRHTLTVYSPLGGSKLDIPRQHGHDWQGAECLHSCICCGQRLCWLHCAAKLLAQAFQGGYQPVCVLHGTSGAKRRQHKARCRQLCRDALFCEPVCGLVTCDASTHFAQQATAGTRSWSHDILSCPTCTVYISRHIVQHSDAHPRCPVQARQLSA
jgi:hypothetical protein